MAVSWALAGAVMLMIPGLHRRAGR
jgi:hypothetical protein